ncbi:NADH pyrophosphatase [Micractinium conductrix]|uniref:NAD(+) diphosphatase n=1 Tax=Micractinium conductrix TaxID=554055 RepID=A0A2P6VQG7_9CHLO|nr:NADH pyrophosphatase [Micractinium conductrix]|eukprot:PSC76346.1 NADH pyrophosphatase [Micractinium conductrix]
MAGGSGGGGTPASSDDGRPARATCCSCALRKQAGKLDRLLREPSTRVLLLHRGRLLVAPDDGGSSGGDADDAAAGSGADPARPLDMRPHGFAPPGEQVPDGGPPAWMPLVTTPQQLQQGNSSSGGGGGDAGASPEFLFLGLEDAGGAVFAVQAPAHLLPLLPPTDGSTRAAPGGACWVDVRKAGAGMTGPDAAVAALAAGLTQWHASAAFCSRTGSPTLASSGGHSRTPTATATDSRRPRSVYPRIDPAVIVAVSCGDWLLLGRKASWIDGRYSCLAGFAELGETLEQAVAREVAEEAGVPVNLGSVRYVGSQPWPFPASLMIGFLAEATNESSSSGSGGSTGAGPAHGLGLLEGRGLMAAREVGLKPAEAQRYLRPSVPAVQVDAAELEDARWFHADWLAAATGAEGAPPRAASRLGGHIPFRVPGRYALANRIIDSWLTERQAAAAAATAAELGERAGTAAEALAALRAVPDVGLDSGSMKYVLLRLSTADGLHSKLLVRGDSRAAYHNHVLQATAAEIREIAPGTGLHLETLGGGRIEHYPEQRIASMYGYSAAFGQAPHHVSAALMRRWMPFHEVSESYDGY